jgi:hypothetical protein
VNHHAAFVENRIISMGKIAYNDRRAAGSRVLQLPEGPLSLPTVGRPSNQVARYRRSRAQVDCLFEGWASI